MFYFFKEDSDAVIILFIHWNVITSYYIQVPKFFPDSNSSMT